MSENTWLEQNQRFLHAELERVRGCVEFRVQSSELRVKNEEYSTQHTAFSASALDLLCVRFGLTPFERDLLLLCAGIALDSGFAQAVMAREPTGTPTFALALAALLEAHWSALLPEAPLRRWRMIELGPHTILTQAALQIDERVLHHLAGLDYLDGRLVGLVQPVEPTVLIERQHDIAEQLAGWFNLQSNCADISDERRKTKDESQQFDPSSLVVGRWSHEHSLNVVSKEPACVQLYEGDAATRWAVAAQACALSGASLWAARAEELPQAPAERHVFARLWEREALLSNRVLLIERGEGEASALAETLRATLILSGNEPAPIARPHNRLAVSAPTRAERHTLWQAALGPSAVQLNGKLDALAAQFQLSAGEIASIANSSETSELWDASRDCARARLDQLAHRIVANVGWDALVLPAAHQATLREITAQVRQRGLVYDTWGFATKSDRGLGITALFAGPSGTGKTLAAEVIAAELRLDLYRIDLSQVVSKYIGETEKNLRRVFDAAEGSGAVLLFDEADALFGRRSEVKDSHDRYANIEVGYLLQRMESYGGLAILTTNQRAALDPAFLRRIRFVLDFPLPDATQRAEIWRRVFPDATPTDGLAFDKLARLHVAGGNIQNIALNAAFRAAEANEVVTMAHLLGAARAECAKIEKPLSEAELAGWSG